MTVAPRRFTGILAAAVVASGVLASAAAAEPQACQTASKFGPQDEVGNLNYVTPARTLAAAKLVTKGKAYRLGIETNKDTPAYPPRWFKLTILQPGEASGATLGPARITGAVQAIVNPVAIR